MGLYFVKPKSAKARFSIERLKVYKKGNLNLTRNLLRVLGLDYEGGEVIAEADPITGKVVLRPARKPHRARSTNLKQYDREEAFLLRGALKDAEEFFKDLGGALRKVFPDAFTEVGIQQDGTVYLKLKFQNLPEGITLLYKETPVNPNGIITLKNKEDEKVVVENPRFSREEAVLITLEMYPSLEAFLKAEKISE